MKAQNQYTNNSPQPSICNSRGISLDIIKSTVKKNYATPKNNSNGGIALTHNIFKPKEKYHSFSPNRLNEDSLLLPPLKPSNANLIKTLVLDLDETLIHSSFSKFPIEGDITLQVIIS